jgi:hypothetical protein
MRYALVLTGVLIAVAPGTASGAGAAPVPGTAWSKAPSAVQPVGYWDRLYSLATKVLLGVVSS